MGDAGLAEQGEDALDHAEDRPHLGAVGRGPLGTAEVRPEQLVGTIDEVEAHGADGREDPGAGTEQAWNDVREVVGSLVSRLRDHYATVAGPDGPSEEEVRGALHTLGEAFERVIESFGSALRDPAVREQARRAAGAVVSALGATFGDVGEELARAMRADGEAGGEEPPVFRSAETTVGPSPEDPEE